MASAERADAHLKQQRSRRTRHDIVLAAAATFNEVGFTAARLHDIGTSAAVTKGALYFHFDSKAALAREVLAAHHRRWALLRAAIGELDLPPIETVVALSVAVAHNFCTSIVARAGVRLGNEYQLIDTGEYRPFVGWIDGVTALLTRARDEGALPAGTECAELGHLIVASYFGMQEVSARLDHGTELITRVRQWWRVVLPAILGDPAAARAILERERARPVVALPTDDTG